MHVLDLHSIILDDHALEDLSFFAAALKQTINLKTLRLPRFWKHCDPPRQASSLLPLNGVPFSLTRFSSGQPTRNLVTALGDFLRTQADIEDLGGWFEADHTFDDSLLNVRTLEIAHPQPYLFLPCRSVRRLLTYGELEQRHERIAGITALRVLCVPIQLLGLYDECFPSIQFLQVNLEEKVRTEVSGSF